MKALTANRLIDGEVVFWRGGRWVEQFGEAELFDDADPAAEGAVAVGKAQPTVIVEPYLIDLVETADGPVPVSYRERIRALGPTNHPTHGKQAEANAVNAAIAHAEGAARSTGRLDLIRRK